MKILMLNHNVIDVGTFHRCRYLAKPLLRRGHQVTIVTNSKTGRLRFRESETNSLRIIECPDLLFGPFRSGWDPINAWRRILRLKSEMFDVIHAFDCRPTVLFPALSLSKRWRCPWISDWCDWWGRGGAVTLREPKWLNRIFEPVETFFEENFRTRAGHVTTISEPLRARAISLGVKEENVTVIPPIADTEEMYPVKKTEARQTLKLDQNKVILIFSSFVKYDIEFLLSAFSYVYAKSKEVLLLITGNQPKSLIRTAAHLPIRYMGQVSQDNLRLCIGASDLCLLPLSDTLANRVRYPDKLRNYLSCGRPVITTRVGEAGKIIEKFDLGVVTAGNPRSFGEGILTALGQSSLFDEWGRRSRHAAETELSEKNYGALLEGIYQHALNDYAPLHRPNTQEAFR